MKGEQSDQNLFCMKQFKPAIVAIVVLAALVLGWTAYLEGGTPRDLRSMAGRGGIMRTATAPPIRFGAKPPHPDWGACDNCHKVYRASGRPPAHKAAAIMQVATAPPINPGARAPHPNWGTCTTCHDIIGGNAGARAVAATQVATVAPPLGVWLRPITPATADRLGLENTDGVLVTGVQSNSSAARADLQVGDVIQRIDDRKVESINEALVMISVKTTGDILKLQVLRNGGIKKIFVEITQTAELANPAVRAAAVAPKSTKIAIAATGRDLGAQVAPLFSNAPAFILYDTATGRFSVVGNSGFGQLNAGQHATAQLSGMGVKAVISGNIGPASLRRLDAAGIEVYSGAFGSVEKVVGQYQRGVLVATRDTVISGGAPGVVGRAPAADGKVAVASTGASLNDRVADDLGLAPYLIIYDLATGQTEVVVKDPAPDQGNSAVETAQLIVERGASAVVAGNISPFSVETLNGLGVFSFAGVSASVGQAVQMYRDGKLRATTVNAPRRNRTPLAGGQGGGTVL